MSDKTHPHSVVLKQAAPGLRGSLIRVLSSFELSLFEELYSHCVGLGATHEGRTRRGAGEAFNPRPARVCKILLRECQEESLTVFMAAVACCLSPRHFCSLDWNLELAPEVRRICRNFHFAFKPEEICIKTERVLLAHSLDSIRHLHMTNLSNTEQIQVVRDTHALLSELPIHSDNIKLYEAILSALRRLEIRLDIEDFQQEILEAANA